MIFLNQSGFRPGDSCANQLLTITHVIYKSFDDGLVVRGVFLDMPNDFEKVWYEGLLLKSWNGISENLLKLLGECVYFRKKQVVLNGQHSSWENVDAGVPQGSIIGPLLILIYIKGLLNGVSSNYRLFSEINDIQSSAVTLRNDLTEISNWTFQWKMIFNPDLTK